MPAYILQTPCLQLAHAGSPWTISWPSSLGVSPLSHHRTVDASVQGRQTTTNRSNSRSLPTNQIPIVWSNAPKMGVTQAILALLSLAALVASAPIDTSEVGALDNAQASDTAQVEATAENAAIDNTQASNSADVEVSADTASVHSAASVQFDPEYNWCYAHKTQIYLRYHVSGQQWNGVNVTEDDFHHTVKHCGLVTEFEWYPNGIFPHTKLWQETL